MASILFNKQHALCCCAICALTRCVRRVARVCARFEGGSGAYVLWRYERDVIYRSYRVVLTIYVLWL